jgi:diguanylate cyclase (GGDEF)-like protein
VNDSCGHIVGDQVIQAVAENLKSSVRASDLLVRYGGDEFLVLIENISLETALKIAEKIRKGVLASEIFQCEELAHVNVSISAGVAVGAASWMALLAKADEALFRAKAKGKNTVSS